MERFVTCLQPRPSQGVPLGTGFFFPLRTALKDPPKGSPTANHQPQPTANRHQSPTTNRHPPCRCPARYKYDNYMFMDSRGKFGKAIGIRALLEKGHQYVLYMDFDAIFEPRLFVGHHPLEPLVVSQKSVILLGEMALCSCHFFVKNSEFGRAFVEGWSERCGRDLYCTRTSRNKTRISDQIAYDLLLYESVRARLPVPLSPFPRHVGLASEGGGRGQ